MDTSVFLRVQVENLEAEIARLREENRTLREWLAEVLRSEAAVPEPVEV